MGGLADARSRKRKAGLVERTRTDPKAVGQGGNDSDVPEGLLSATAREALEEIVELSTKADGAGLKEWFERSLTDEGLFGPAPWSTHRLVIPLERLRRAGPAAWTVEDDARLRGVLESTLRLATGGTWIRSDAEPVSRETVAAVGRLLKQPAFRSLRRPAWWLWRAGRSAGRVRAPMPGMQSDRAQIALLRRDWSSEPTCLAVDYSRPGFAAAFFLRGRALLAPQWDFDVRCSGRPLKVMGLWENTCWFTDMDGEYAEFRRIVGGGVILERQLYLSRRMPLLFVADTLKSPMAEPLELVWRWRMAGGLSASAGTEKRFLEIHDGESTHRWLPFGYSPATFPKGFGAADWPAGQRFGVQAEVEGDALIFRGFGTGKRLMLPTVLQWNVEPSAPAPVYVPLTVTNERRRVPPTEAVAFRLPLGDQQVIFYRALQSLELYTFLGYQTRAECVIGDFDRNGKIHEWVNVE